MPCVAVRYIFSARATRKQERLAAVNAKKAKKAEKAAAKTATKATKLASANAKKAAKLAKKQKKSTKATRANLRTNKTPQNLSIDEILKVPHGRKPSRAQLINAESRLGSQIFGPIPEGHQREFFHDKQNIWIWHEAWTDERAHHHQLTVRYEVRKTGVYKKVAAGAYFKLDGAELDNFRKAANTYLRVVKKWLYNY